MYVEVAIEQAKSGFDKLYTYQVPLHLAQGIGIGTTVLVPFGRGRAKPRIGVVLKEISAPEKLRGIKLVLAAAPAEKALTQEGMAMVQYLKKATFCTWYEAVKTVVPRGARYCVAQKDDGEWVLQTELHVPQDIFYKRKEDFENQGATYTQKQERVLSFLGAGPKEKQEICRTCLVGSFVLQGLVKKGVVEVYRQPRDGKIAAYPEVAEVGLPVLNDAQQQVLDALLEKEKVNDVRPALLYGVTGSGKTAVFLHLAQYFLQRKKTCLLLVPEIGLTPQMIQTFRMAFAGRVAVQHSGLSQGERFAQWESVRERKVDVVIGTRSAVFMPLANIGLIVVDEEQERSYQSEAAPRYDAIEVAKRRARRHGALLVLASATPTVSDYYAAEQGVYSLHKLLHRFGNLPLPSVEMADMRAEMKTGNAGAIGAQLTAAITEMLHQKRQIILLLNRRGYHRVGVCRVCATVLKCDNCSVPMIYHRGKYRPSVQEGAQETQVVPENKQGEEQTPSALAVWKKLNVASVQDEARNSEDIADGAKLLCHYCAKKIQPAPQVCPDCGGEIRYTGFGTQRVEEELQLRFPTARVMRMDLDTTRRKGAHEKMLREFAEGAYDILLGTQMVAKGLDFENVGLVGVVGIDSLLFGQGYRTPEHVFSLVTQVVGRAGRFEEHGYAMVQTLDPDNAVLQLAAQQNYPEFYKQEIGFRQMALYPPFCKLCVVGFVADEEEVAVQSAHLFARILSDEARRGLSLPLRVLGPAPMQVSKVAGQWRWRLTIKCRADAAFRRLLENSLKQYGQYKQAKRANIYVDFNADTVY